MSALSRRYPSLGGRFPCVTHPSATPYLRRSCDLHVLGTPPAFILSQDQTRHPECILNLVTRPKCIVNELSPIDRINICSCVFYPYHSSVVQVLRLLPHLRILHRLAGLAGSCRMQVRYYHRLCALSSTFCAILRSGQPAFDPMLQRRAALEGDDQRVAGLRPRMPGGVPHAL